MPTSQCCATRSMVQRGRIYEHNCQRFLQTKLGMRVEVTGGAHDNGVDLLGHWCIASASGGEMRLPVIGQCKHYSRSLGPRFIRELEGTHSYFMQKGRAPRDSPLAIMLCSNGFSVQSILRSRSSQVPMLLLHLSDDGDKELADLACRGALYNDAWSHIVKDAFRVDWHHTRKGMLPKFQTKLCSSP